MNTNEIIEKLRYHEPQLRQRGVARLSIFGSVARGDAKPDSDIDILVDIDPSASVGMFEYADLAQFLAKMLPEAPVDLTNRATMKPYVSASAEKDVIDVF